ncbi:alpha/beta hydrolase [Gluconacetobacter tumulisoli]|uniref:Alpha/beta hydrolase n=2 Tax=Gluconacetobacter tumulisoli TaxID=1286189 RepID=A0A7W4K5L0_9PROT|nr:alpha/beta hydrolase [Gluconacetobacter tumulisoli]
MSTVNHTNRISPWRGDRPAGQSSTGTADAAPVVAPSLMTLSAFEIVIVPGLYGSGPDHWQSRWEAFLHRQGVTVRRVVQRNWANPTYRAWGNGLRHAMRACRRPAILVAHSLGAVLVARRASEHRLGIAAGALLVAPADVEQHAGPDACRVGGFAPLPVTPLPFPSLLIASRNDEWLSPARADALAARWGSTLVDAGRIGHIGSASDIGLWPDGLSALLQLARSLPIPRDGPFTPMASQ